jgi:hypothetical protein
LILRTARTELRIDYVGQPSCILLFKRSSIEEQSDVVTPNGAIAGCSHIRFYTRSFLRASAVKVRPPLKGLMLSGEDSR